MRLSVKNTILINFTDINSANNRDSITPRDALKDSLSFHPGSTIYQLCVLGQGVPCFLNLKWKLEIMPTSNSCLRIK